MRRPHLLGSAFDKRLTYAEIVAHNRRNSAQAIRLRAERRKGLALMLASLAGFAGLFGYAWAHDTALAKAQAHYVECSK